MGFISKIKSIFQPKAMNSHELERLIMSVYGGGLSSSGVSVNSETAMRLMTVHNCVKVLYNCVSQMPCQLMEDVNDVKCKAKEHYLYRKIGKFPNSWMTAAEFWGMAIVHLSLRGNFYAFKVGLPNRDIKALVPIAPGRVEKITQNDDYSIIYTIKSRDGSTTSDYRQDQIFHIRGMSLGDGLVGMNPIEYARESIGLGLTSERFLGQWFGSGLHPGAIVKHPQILGVQTHANMKAALKEKMAENGKDHGLVLLDEGMDIVFPPIRLVDAQFLELGRFNEAQICGMFGIPLMMVQAGDSPTTYASATEFKRTFVDMTITPIAVNFESVIDRDLLREEEQDRYYAKFNVNSLLRGNLTERFAAYQVGVNAEILNPNECRHLEDMNGYEGGEVYRTRTSSLKSEDMKPAEPKKDTKNESGISYSQKR